MGYSLFFSCCVSDELRCLDVTFSILWDPSGILKWYFPKKNSPPKLCNHIVFYKDGRDFRVMCLILYGDLMRNPHACVSHLCINCVTSLFFESWSWKIRLLLIWNRLRRHFESRKFFVCI
jgi:hypothetical protein